MRGDREAGPAGGRARHSLRPDGDPAPRARAIPSASRGGVRARGHSRAFRLGHAAAQSRRPGLPRAARLRRRRPFRTQVRRVPEPRRGAAGGVWSAAGRAPFRRSVGTARFGADGATRRRARPGGGARAAGGPGRAGRRGSSARSLALGAASHRRGRDRRPGALEAEAGRTRSTAAHDHRRVRRGRSASAAAGARACRPRRVA